MELPDEFPCNPSPEWFVDNFGKTHKPMDVQQPQSRPPTTNDILPQRIRPFTATSYAAEDNHNRDDINYTARMKRVNVPQHNQVGCCFILLKLINSRTLTPTWTQYSSPSITSTKTNHSKATVLKTTGHHHRRVTVLKATATVPMVIVMQQQTPVD